MLQLVVPDPGQRSLFRVFFDLFFFQAEAGIRDLVRLRGLGDVYKRQHIVGAIQAAVLEQVHRLRRARRLPGGGFPGHDLQLAVSLAADPDPGHAGIEVDQERVEGPFDPVSYTHLTLPTSVLV